MAAEQRLIRLALFGSPVARSLSPRIHQAFAAQADLPVEYRAIDCSAEELEARLAQLASQGGRGCNITLPLKRRACELAARLSERAQRAGAVNTLCLENDGTWYGDNTDGSGLVRDLLDNVGIALSGRDILVLGAGGAAAGILYDLLLQRPARLVLANRSPGRAQALADRLRAAGEVTPVAAAGLAERGPFDLVINATSAGHSGDLPSLSPRLFAAGAACYDLNYGSAHAVLGDWCAARNITCHHWLGMLVEQAAESFRIWTGYAPRTGPVINDLAASIAAR
jgi:shikimate dehydrogenase